MRRRTTSSRSAVALTVVALAAGVAGCGGSDGGGSDGDAYASTWNTACTSLSKAQTTLQSEGAAAQGTSTTDKSKLAKALAAPVSKFADAMTAALDRVKDLDAPKEFSTFQAGVAKSAPSTISVLKSLKAPLARGDVRGTQAAIGKIDPKSVFPAIPAALKQQASACSVF